MRSANQKKYRKKVVDLKRLMIVAVLLLLPFHLRAQEQGVKTKVFYGLNWESNIGFVSGACLEMPFGLKSFPYARFGLDTGSYTNGLQTDKGFGLEVGYTFKETPKYSLTLLAGAGVDWTAPTAEVKNWTTYLPQSAGVLATYTLPPSTPLLGWVLPSPFGIALWTKFRPQLFAKESLWKDKLTAGVALYGSL